MNLMVILKNFSPIKNKLAILLIAIFLLSGCQQLNQIKTETDDFKKQVGKGINDANQNVQDQIDNTTKAIQKAKNEAVQTKKVIDEKVEQIQDATNKINEAQQKIDESKKALEKVVK